MEQEYYDYTLEQLIQELEENEELTESGLSNILPNENFYFSIYKTDEQFGDFTMGFFIIYLKDGVALFPFDDFSEGNGWEQLRPDLARYATHEDYDLLINAKNMMQRRMEAIDKTVEKMKLRLLVNKGITKEKL